MGQVQADQRRLLQLLSSIDRLVANAAGAADAHAVGELPAPPAQKVAVLTCMDARIDPRALLGLEAGDAHVLRNAGACVTDDVIRSLAFSQHMLGTREVMVIKHTRCGVQGAEDQDLLDLLPEAPAWAPQTFGEIDQAVRDEVEALRSSPFLEPMESVRGFVFDIDTGTLREID